MKRFRSNRLFGSLRVGRRSTVVTSELHRLSSQIVSGESRPSALRRVRGVAVQSKRLHALQFLILGKGKGRAAIILHRAGTVQHGVSRRAGGDIFIHGRHLLVPADAESAPLGDVQVELHAQHAGRSGGGNESSVAVGAEFFCDDELDDEVVFGLETTSSLEVTHGVAERVDARFELHADLAAGSIKVGLPALLFFVVANDASLLVKNTLALTTNLMCVLGAGLRDDLLVLLNSPHHLAQTPAGLSFLALVDDSAQRHLDRESTDGVHHGGEHNAAGEVGWRENPNGGLVVAGKDRALDVHRHLEGVLFSVDVVGAGREEVFDLA